MNHRTAFTAGAPTPPSVHDLNLVTYVESPRSLPCPTCGAAVDLARVEWCQCVTKPLSVVCPSCHNCSCKLRDFPKRAEWTCVIRELLQGQTEEKFRRALNTTPTDAGGRPTVLVVDDDEEIRLIAEYSIQQMGYHVITAAGPQEALDLIERSKPDIVLTDALMPKIDGRQLCRLIKAANPSIKVVIMTALYKSPRYRVEAMSTYRADEYLAKPIDFAHLHNVLENLSAKAAA
ncbi:MAG: response regulator [Acidobacteriota bacterium]